MSNILPKAVKSTLMWRKYVRIVWVVSLMGISGLAVASASLLPIAAYSYMVGLPTTNGVEPSGNSGGESSSLGQQRQELIAMLKQDARLLGQVAAVTALPDSGQTLNGAIGLVSVADGVEMRSVSIGGHADRGLYIIRLSGTAVSRSAVVAVQDIFDESDDFVVIDFPTGNLTPRDGEYNFTIELSTKLSIKDDE